MFGASVEVLELLAQRERIDALLMQKVGVFVASGEWGAIYDLETPRNQLMPTPPPSIPRQ